MANLSQLQRGSTTYDLKALALKYIVGTGTAAKTSSPYCFSKWEASASEITSLYDGLTILYKVPVAGNGTYGTCLQLNSLGYHPVVVHTNSMVSTRYGVGAMVMLVYNSGLSGSVYGTSAGANATAAASITGVWVVVNDYDANTNTLLRTYASTSAVELPLVAVSTATTATTSTYTSGYKDSYGQIPSTVANRATINLSTGELKAKQFTGDLEGLASQALADSAGNNIVNTYATKADMNALVAATDAMTFKGTLGTGGTVTSVPASHTVGDTYKVITASTWAGQKCEVGDLLICITTSTSANNAHWTVAQTNIDGAVTGPTSATTSNFAAFNGTSGKVIQDSGYGPGDFSAVGHKHPFSDITDRPTTLSGYGITDARPAFYIDFDSSAGVGNGIDPWQEISINIDQTAFNTALQNGSPIYFRDLNVGMLILADGINDNGYHPYISGTYHDYNNNTFWSNRCDYYYNDTPNILQWWGAVTFNTASSSHSHGNITSDGKVGTASNKALYTGTSGTVTAGTLPVAAGGTGATSVTQYGVVYGSSTTAYSSVKATAANQVLTATSSSSAPVWKGISAHTYTYPTGATSRTADVALNTVTVLASVSSAGSPPTLGTAIAADDITNWSAGSAASLTTSTYTVKGVNAITAGSAASLTTSTYTVKGVNSAGTMFSASVSGEVLTLTAGSAPTTSSYTIKGVNVWTANSPTAVTTSTYTIKGVNAWTANTVPSLTYTARSIPNVTAVGSMPTFTTTSVATSVKTQPTFSVTTSTTTLGHTFS